LLDAVGRMTPPPRLKIAGQGPLMPADRCVSPNVEWLGHQPRHRIIDLMKGAAVLIVPSEWYETGVLTIIEAFATGLPVLASRLGTMAEMVTEGVTGLLFSPQEAQNLADVMQWALAHPVELTAMAGRARQEFERKYAGEPNYRAMMAIYQEAMKRE
jgi:glycosyltransferase involved in cell wall biosynthesis